MQARTAFGITYFPYTLHDWRKLRSPHDIPRHHWSILHRKPTNFELANRIDRRDGAIPQLGGVDHIGAGFEDRVGVDTGAEALNEYGLNPGNTRASWTAGGDSDTICLLAPPDTRAWMHGVSDLPVDFNSLALGYEDGIYSPNWNALPEPKKTAHLRMRAAFWALWFGYKRWPLIYTPDRNEVVRLARQGRSWGLTQHGDLDPRNRSDAGIIYSGGRRVNTFPYDRLFAMMREEMAIRTSGKVTTPSAPKPDPKVKVLQGLVNKLGYNLDVDGSRGPLTETALTEITKVTGWTGKTDTAALITHLEDTVAKLDDILTLVKAQDAKINRLEKAVQAVPARVFESRVNFQEGTYLRRIFGKDFRAGALLGYAAGYAHVGSGEDQEEILAEIRSLGDGAVTSTEGPAEAVVEEPVEEV